MTICVDLVGDELGDFLLVGGTEDKLGILSITKLVQLASHDMVATGLMPQSGGKEVGQGKSGSGDSGEFVVYDVGDVADDAKSVRKESEDARGGRADVAAAKEKLERGKRIVTGGCCGT